MMTLYDSSRCYSRRRSKRPPYSGFTLIEVVVSVAILAVLLTIAYSSLTGMLRAKRLLDDRRALRAVADTVLLRVTRELQLASATDRLLPPRETPNEPMPASIVLRGMMNTERERRRDSISFIARSGGQYLSDGSGNTGIVQITYRVESDPDARSTDTPWYLVREEVPYIFPAEDAFKRSIVFPLTNQLVELRFRYFWLNDGTWLDEWGSEPRTGLPSAVELYLVLRSHEGREETLSTIIPLRRVE